MTVPRIRRLVYGLVALFLLSAEAFTGTQTALSQPVVYFDLTSVQNAKEWKAVHDGAGLGNAPEGLLVKIGGDGPPATPTVCYFNGTTYLDEKLLLKQSSGDEFYYLLGHLYTVGGLTDAGGSLVEWYSYTGYGLPTTHTVTTSPGNPNGGDVGIMVRQPIRHVVRP